MADIVLDDQIPVEPAQFDNEDFTVEVVDDDGAAAKDDATLALEAKIAEMEQKQGEYLTTIEGLQANSAQGQSMASLAQEIKNMAAPAAVAPDPAQPQVDYGALIESTDKNFYNSPSKSTLDITSPLFQSMDQKINEATARNMVSMSKMVVLTDDSMKGDYIKYKDEVDKFVAGSPPSEDIYSKALRAVRGNHIEDIIAEKVAAQMLTITEKAEASATEAAKPAQPQFTNATQVQQAQAKKVMRITPRQQEIARKFAITKGYDWNDAGEQKWVVSYLKGKGVI